MRIGKHLAGLQQVRPRALLPLHVHRADSRVKLRAEQGEQQGLEILPHPPLVHAQYAQGLFDEEEVAAFAGAACDATIGEAAAGGGGGGGVGLEGRQSTPPLRCRHEVVGLIK